MELEAYGEMIVCKEEKTQAGKFVMTENNRATVVSVGDKVDNLNVGDSIFYEANKKENIGEYFVIHKASVLCKVIE
tara:strand:+ start:1140 stop:1367 length:228 start_codon:yes stop_codon:yes gene_type:complete